MSASVLRSGGCSAFVKTGLSNPCPVEDPSPLEKHSRQILALISAQRDLTLDEIVSALHKRQIPEVVARCPASSPVMALPSKKVCRRRSASEPTWRVHADAGFASKAFLTRPTSYLSTRRQSPLTCCGSTGWRSTGSAWSAMPRWNWETVTFLAGLRQTGVVAPMLIKGAMNGEAFLASSSNVYSQPEARDIVVVDNVPFHKVAGVEEAIQAVGASLRYLPPYSPDLNPIRCCFIL